MFMRPLVEIIQHNQQQQIRKHGVYNERREQLAVLNRQRVRVTGNIKVKYYPSNTRYTLYNVYVNDSIHVNHFNLNPANTNPDLLRLFEYAARTKQPVTFTAVIQPYTRKKTSVPSYGLTNYRDVETLRGYQAGSTKFFSKFKITDRQAQLLKQIVTVTYDKSIPSDKFEQDLDIQNALNYYIAYLTKHPDCHRLEEHWSQHWMSPRYIYRQPWDSTNTFITQLANAYYIEHNMYLAASKRLGLITKKSQLPLTDNQVNKLQKISSLTTKYLANARPIVQDDLLLGLPFLYESHDGSTAIAVYTNFGKHALSRNHFVYLYAWFKNYTWAEIYNPHNGAHYKVNLIDLKNYMSQNGFLKNEH